MVFEQTIYKRAVFSGKFSELTSFDNGLKIGFKVYATLNPILSH